MEIRAQTDAETAKALLLINGGGAIALLSIFTAIVGKSDFEPPLTALLWAVLWAVFGMMMGLVFAVAHNQKRRECSLYYEQHKMMPPTKGTSCLFCTVFLWVSLACFFLAGGGVAITGLANVTKLQKKPAPAAAVTAAAVTPDAKKQ